MSDEKSFQYVKILLPLFRAVVKIYIFLFYLTLSLDFKKQIDRIKKMNEIFSVTLVSLIEGSVHVDQF